MLKNKSTYIVLLLVLVMASCAKRGSITGGLKDTIAGFKAIVAGEYDHLPEQAFYMVGGIEEVIEKAKTLQ